MIVKCKIHNFAELIELTLKIYMSKSILLCAKIVMGTCMELICENIKGSNFHGRRKTCNEWGIRPMELKKLTCPNCNGTLNLEVENKKYIFCPYCGQQFLVEDGKQEITRNINIKKDVNVTKRTINDAEVIRAKTADRAKTHKLLDKVGILLVYVALIGALFWFWDFDDREAKKAAEDGRISAGSDEDYVGENYEAVVDQLETLGFTNVKAIDLDDAGITFWKADKVESVSIGGDTSFFSGDYFDPDVTIIVKYH